VEPAYCGKDTPSQSGFHFKTSTFRVKHRQYDRNDSCGAHEDRCFLSEAKRDRLKHMIDGQLVHPSLTANRAQGTAHE
jgi:hypothetical protein